MQQNRPARAAGERGFLPLALLLTLTLGLVDPAGAARVTSAREPARSLWSVALSRAVEAMAEAGECPPNAATPVATMDEPRRPALDAPIPGIGRTIAERGEGDLPPPVNA